MFLVVIRRSNRYAPMSRIDIGLAGVAQQPPRGEVWSERGEDGENLKSTSEGVVRGDNNIKMRVRLSWVPSVAAGIRMDGDDGLEMAKDSSRLQPHSFHSLAPSPTSPHLTPSHTSRSATSNTISSFDAPSSASRARRKLPHGQDSVELDPEMHVGHDAGLSEGHVSALCLGLAILRGMAGSIYSQHTSHSLWTRKIYTPQKTVS